MILLSDKAFEIQRAAEKILKGRELNPRDLQGRGLNPDEIIIDPRGTVAAAIRSHIIPASTAYTKVEVLRDLAGHFNTVEHKGAQQLGLFGDPESKTESLEQPHSSLVAAMRALDEAYQTLLVDPINNAVDQRTSRPILKHIESSNFPELVNAVLRPAQELIEPIFDRIDNLFTNALQGADALLSGATELPNSIVKLSQFLEVFNSLVRCHSYAEPLSIENEGEFTTALQNNSLDAKIFQRLSEVLGFVEGWTRDQASITHEQVEALGEGIRSLSRLIPAYLTDTVGIWHRTATTAFRNLNAWLQVTVRTPVAH